MRGWSLSTEMVVHVDEKESNLDLSVTERETCGDYLVVEIDAAEIFDGVDWQ